MSQNPPPEIGTISWTDLTVENAEQLRDFYAAVTGWQPGTVDMGGYDDFNMQAPASGTPVAGICHARGSNAGLPPQWLIYITVEDVDASAARSAELGGEVLAGPSNMGAYGRHCVIRDPAGAVAALFTPKESIGSPTQDP
jgi:predicted enzyme related to lactoylglutathione lyase